MHWMVRLSDEAGSFWFQFDQTWSDDVEDGQKFATEKEATKAASAARARTSSSHDWYPRIEVVAFRK